jgi:hypothetical protein
MKTANPLFTLVIVRENEVATALEFNYYTAKEIMINTFSLTGFNINTDEGLIFVNDGSGAGEAIYNYRAHYLNQEPEIYEPPTKENVAVKVMFNCPKCGSNDGKLSTDEDGDILIICRNQECKKTEIVQ